jgi:hypothetical protein
LQRSGALLTPSSYENGKYWTINRCVGHWLIHCLCFIVL